MSILFFEFMRISYTLRMNPTNSDLLIFFENVASMPKEDVETISRHFNMPPLRLNASKVSPARRNRFYWLNWQPEVIVENEAKLQDVLSRCGKGEALYEKAYCIRSWGGSSYRGTANLSVRDVLRQAHDCNPVRLAPGMDKFRKLNVSEACGCLGFPLHYCVQSNASVSHMHTMLGSSFSIHMVVHLLRPLLDSGRFATKVYDTEYTDPEW